MYARIHRGSYAVTRNLGARIRQARRRVGMTQSQLAERLKVGRSAVGNWESTTGISPASARLREVAVVTGVSYEWLATGRGDPAAHELERPAVDGELVDDPLERRLLSAFRTCRSTTRRVVLQMIEIQAAQQAR